METNKLDKHHNGHTTETPPYSMNQYALSFPPRQEADFQHQQFQQNLKTIQLSIFLGILFYAAYGIFDYYLFPDLFHWLILIRLGLFTPLGLVTLMLSFHRSFIRFWKILIFLLVVIAGNSISTLVLITTPPNHYSYFAGILVVFLFCYTFSKLPFTWASFAGWTIVIYHLSTHFLISESAMPLLFSNAFIIVSSNIAGMFACYSIESAIRVNTIKTEQLDAEKNRVRQINDVLEERVKDRTESLNSINLNLKQEIEKRIEAQSRLEYYAKHDDLTGLLNRWAFNNDIASITQLENPTKTASSLLFIDLDRFKDINDSVGHHVGDLLLTKVAERLKVTAGASNRLYRMGGDEFIVLLPGITQKEEILQCSTLILDTIQKPFTIDEHEFRLSASIGVSIFPTDATQPVDLVRYADAALYEAKEQGSNQCVFFTSKLDERLHHKLTIERKLRVALQKNHFYIAYQPQVNWNARQIVGFEALIRLHDPEEGEIQPGQFIGIAEEVGLIVPIGKWVIKTACEEFLAFTSELTHTCVLSINVSLQQLQDPAFITHLQETLGMLQFPGNKLCLEITENVLIKDPDRIQETLLELENMGIRISIDDFGTGFSSLSYLSRLSIHELKVDRSFVSRIGQTREDEIIIQSTLSLGKSLGLQIVCEGVENELQVDYITSHGGHIIQGYLITRPLSKNAMKEFVEEWAHNHPLSDI